jgi:hypothetical protein
MRDLPNAMKNFDQAIQLKPKYPNAFYNRSVARKLAGDAKGAAEDAAKSAELAK